MAFLRFVFSCGLVVALFGCGDNLSNRSENLSCTPDDDLIAEKRDCRSDEQCPCGAHCSMGLCTASCSTASDCASGQACDGFGRCRAGDVGKQVVSRGNSTGGRPRIAQRAIARGNPDQPRLLTVIADEAPIEAARIVADPGTEVALAKEGTDPEDLEYAPEVLVEETIDEADSVNIYVRTTEEDDPDVIEDLVNVTVLTADNKTTSVSVIDTASFAGLPALEAPPLEGTYQGFARLTRTGVASGFSFSGSKPERDVSTLLSAQVFPASGDGATIIITDPLRLLHPEGQWVGKVILEDDPRVEMPAFEQIPEASALGSVIHIATATGGGALISDPQLDNWPGTLRFNLDLLFVGSSSNSNGPQQTWEIAFGRTGDLPPNAIELPELPEPTLAFDPDVAAETPLPREAAFLEAIDDPSPVNSFADVRFAWLDNRDQWFSPAGHVCVAPSEIVEDAPTTTYEPETLTGGFDIQLERGEGQFEIPYPTGLAAFAFLFSGIYLYPGWGGQIGFTWPVQDISCSIDTDCTSSLAIQNGDPAVYICGSDNICIPRETVGMRPITPDEFTTRSGTPFANFLNAPVFRSWVDATTFIVDGGTEEPVIRLFTASYYTSSGPPPTSYALTGGGELDFAIPCSIDVPALEEDAGNTFLPPGLAIEIDPSLVSLDLCDEIADVLECEVLDIRPLVSLSERTLAAPASVFFALSGETTVNGDFLAMTSPDDGSANPTVEKVCVLPSRPISCVEATLCDDVTDTGDIGFDRLGQTTSSLTGDLFCEGGGGAGLNQAMDFTTRPAAEMKDACRIDLASFDSLPAAVSGVSTRAKLNSIGWAGGAECLDAQRFVTQLAIAGSTARELGGLGGERIDDEADAIFIRLLQRYFQTLNFITGDALSGAAQAADEATAGGGLAVLEAALATSTEGWNLILHPRIGSAMSGLSGAAIADPDYRRRVNDDVPNIAPQHTQEHGVAVNMMELLASQMEVLELIIDRHARAGARVAPDSVADALRVMVIVEAQIAGLVNRARAANPGLDPRWLPRHDLAKGRFEGARARAFLSLNAAVRGANPLGIEEDDLPLYFSEIATDAGSRFSAISDFILGDGPVSNAAAPAALNIAFAAFDDARASRTAEEMRLVNIENNTADFNVAKAAARSDLGALVQDYCGPSYFGGINVQSIATRILDDITNGTSSPPSVGGGTVEFESCWKIDDPVACPAQSDLDAAFATQRSADRLGEQMDLIASVEKGIKNSLCVATLSSTEFPLPEDQRCANDLFFEPDVFSPVPLEFGFRGRGCLQERPPGSWFGLYDCRPPLNNGVRRTGGSLALRRLEEEYYEKFGDIMATQPAIFIAANTTCERFATAQVDIPFIPYGAGSPNYCGGGAPGPGGFFPEVTYTPSRPPSDTEPGGAPSVTTLTCDPIYDPGNLIVITVSADELAVDVPAELATKTSCDGMFERDLLGFNPEERQFDVTNAFCFRGSLGAEAATLTTLNGEIQAANGEVDDMFEEYSISQNTCKILARGNEQLQEAESDFADEIIALRSAKAAMDSAASFAGAAADCLANLAGVASSIENPATLIADGVAGGLSAASCGSSFAEASFETVSNSIDAAMGTLENRHEELKLKISSASEEKQCFNEAELALVGLQTQRLRIQIALQEMQNGIAAFIATTQQAESELDRALANVVTADDSETVTVNADSLLGQDQERLRRAMRLARRAAYLAVRAVEYEFQMSLSDNAVVLAAETPAELEEVLNNLRSLTNTGSPNGNRPAELTEVFSLRRHLLQLAGTEESVPDTEQQLTDEDRFRMLLLDPRFEVFENGEFIGREIPFVVAPLGSLNLGDTTGVPIVADNSCAERLWSLNLSVQGDPERVYTGLTPQVNLELRKRNTFFANFCGSNPEPFQVASTRPSKNLFREPGVAEGYSIQGGSQTDLLSKARVQALLNIEPGEFVTDAYVDGASTELAGRLLFGDYSLFIPATSIAPVNDAGAPTGEGLVLSEMDDILIRVDYLSVAR